MQSVGIHPAFWCWAHGKLASKGWPQHPISLLQRGKSGLHVQLNNRINVWWIFLGAIVHHMMSPIKVSAIILKTSSKTQFSAFTVSVCNSLGNSNTAAQLYWLVAALWKSTFDKEFWIDFGFRQSAHCLLSEMNHSRLLTARHHGKCLHVCWLLSMCLARL